MTRESMMHLGIYEAILGVGAVLHAHPRYIARRKGWMFIRKILNILQADRWNVSKKLHIA